MASMTNRQIPAKVTARESFSTGNRTVTAERNPQHVNAGRLDQFYVNKLFGDLEGEGIAYVVYSYATPIMWETKSGKVVQVQQKFSPTTTRHQHAVAMGLIRPLVSMA